MLEKLMRLALLYDFYGPLLTDKQQKFIEFYYHQDWSLGEIAEHYRISRQAVHDLLRRAEAALEEYEGKLHLVDRFWEQRALVEELAELFHDLQDDLSKWLESGHPRHLRGLRGRIREGRKLVRRMVSDV